MTIHTGTTDPDSQKPYPIALKHYEWVKDEIEKLLTTKFICTSCSSWSAPIIVVPKGTLHLIIHSTLNSFPNHIFNSNLNAP